MFAAMFWVEGKKHQPGLEIKDELCKCTCLVVGRMFGVLVSVHAEWEQNQIPNWLWGGGLCSPETGAAVLPIMHYLSL